jgi:hypothetical protein
VAGPVADGKKKMVRASRHARCLQLANSVG